MRFEIAELLSLKVDGRSLRNYASVYPKVRSSFFVRENWTPERRAFIEREAQ